MHLMGMGKQMKYEELLAHVEDIMDRNAPPVPQMCVTPIGNMLRYGTVYKFWNLNVQDFDHASSYPILIPWLRPCVTGYDEWM
jgi:hypothetical protein